MGFYLVNVVNLSFLQKAAKGKGPFNNADFLNLHTFQICFTLVILVGLLHELNLHTCRGHNLGKGHCYLGVFLLQLFIRAQEEREKTTPEA